MNFTTHWLVFKMCFHEYDVYFFCLNYKKTTGSGVVLNLKQILERIRRKKSKHAVRMEPAAISWLSSQFMALQPAHGSPKALLLSFWFSEGLMALWWVQGSPSSSGLSQDFAAILMALQRTQESLKDSWLYEGLWLSNRLRALQRTQCSPTGSGLSHGFALSSRLSHSFLHLLIYMRNLYDRNSLLPRLLLFLFSVLLFVFSYGEKKA